MGDKNIITFGAAMTADVLSALSIPVGSTLASFAQSYVDKKRREAAEILIQEISGGLHGPIQFEDYDIDPLIVMMYRFSKAVESGTAVKNLRFIAQVIAGLKKRKSLDPDAFCRWCSILESLNRNELLVIGISCGLRRGFDRGVLIEKDSFWRTLRRRLVDRGFSDIEVLAICCSLTRTGLFVPVSTYGGIAYDDTPWLKELCELSDIYIEDSHQ